MHLQYFTLIVLSAESYATHHGTSKKSSKSNKCLKDQCKSPFTLSIQTIWKNEEKDVNSINFWKCLKNKTCPMYSQTRRNSTSLCNFDKCVSITWTRFQKRNRKRNLSLTISSKGEIETRRFINTSIEKSLALNCLNFNLAD
eukprot:XP_019927702.1 PREDICTED: uncharacterized protein LOC109620204 [Crassostrea gigas]